MELTRCSNSPHAYINITYIYIKNILTHFKLGGRHAEKHAAIKYFTAYIKDAARYYRTFVQCIVQSLNLADLEPVLIRLNRPFKPSLSGAANVPTTDMLCCVQSVLVQLGDLSQYRELYNTPTTKNWGPAWGFYSLARAVFPQQGFVYNQMAALSTLEDENDHLTPIFYLHVGVCVNYPAVEAKSNVEIQLQKVLDSEDGIAGLVPEFLKEHAGKRSMFNMSDLLEEAINSRSISARQLKQMTIINICACYRLYDLSEGIPLGTGNIDHMRKVVLELTQIHYRKMLCLLSQAVGTKRSNGTNKLNSQARSIVRRVLPSIRLYSKWILHVFATHSFFEQVLRQVNRLFWDQIVSTGNVLVSMYPPSSIPKLGILLEEDYDFRGLTNVMGNTTGRAVDPGMQTLKQILRTYDQQHQKTGKTLNNSFSSASPSPSSSDDIVMRISDFIDDLQSLAKYGRISFDKLEFVSIEPTASESLNSSLPVGVGVGSVAPASAGAADDTISFSLTQMVDNIVGLGRSLGQHNPVGTNGSVQTDQVNERSSNSEPIAVSAAAAAAAVSLTAADLLQQVQFFGRGEDKVRNPVVGSSSPFTSNVKSLDNREIWAPLSPRPL